MEFLNRLVAGLMRLHHRMRRWHRILLSMAMIVVFVTTYALILPAISLDEETTEALPGIGLEETEEGQVSEELISPESEAAESVITDSQEETAPAPADSEETDLAATEEVDETEQVSAEETAEAFFSYPEEGCDTAEVSADNGTEPSNRVEIEEDIEVETDLTPEYLSTLSLETEGFDVLVTFRDGRGVPAGTELVFRTVDKEAPEDMAFLPCYEAAFEEYEKMNAGKVRTALLYEMSFRYMGEMIPADASKMDVLISYKNNTVSHADDYVSGCLFSGAVPGSESLEPVRACLVTKNADGSDAVTMVDDIIAALEMKDIRAENASVLLGLFAAERPEEFPAAVFDENVGTISVHVEAPEGAFPAGTTMSVKPVDTAEVLDAVQEAIGETVPMSSATALDITFYDAEGVEVQPGAEIKVSFIAADTDALQESKIVHIDDDGQGSLVESTMEDEAAVIEVSDFSIYVIVGTKIEKTVLASDGHNYTVTATYGPETEIPEDAELAVAEITAGSALYDAYVADAEAALGWEAGAVSYARLFDIKIVDRDNTGIQYQPAEGTSVDVRIELADKSCDHLRVVHFSDEGEAAAPVENGTNPCENGAAVVFAAEGFSVYAIVEAPSPVSVTPTSVASLGELGENYGDEGGFVLSYNGNHYFTNQLNGNSCYIETNSISDASPWFFERGADENTYYIYTMINGEKKYMRNTSGNLMGFADADGTLFEMSQASDGKFYFKKRGENRWLQHSNGGGGIRLYTDNNNAANSQISITYVSSLTMGKDPYSLDGMTYGIAYNNDSVVAAAMSATEKTVGSQHRLEGLDMLMRTDVVHNAGTLLVAEDSDIQEWTFESFEEDEYYIRTTVDGTVKYLVINGGNVSLTDEKSNASLITATPGTGANSGKWHFTVNHYSLNFTGSSANGFNAANNNGATTWLHLVERSSLSEEDFVLYSGRKISVSDESLSTNEDPQVVIYTRVWNETTKKYEFYAVDHDGSLIRVYDSGDLINWVGNQVNSALWAFTEYTNPDGTPNYYYELQNTAYPNTYLVPRAEGIISNQPVGINLNGRRDGFDYTTILAWDDIAYGYSGLKVVTDADGGKRVVSCPMDEADDFYFAKVDHYNAGGTVSTLDTVDNTEFGISMRMVDFNNPVLNRGGNPANNISGRDSGQTAILGYDTNAAGLLSTNLESNGYPNTNSSVTTKPQASLGDLFASAGTVNHLFIESAYNESGYFVYDSTQNFAHLEGDGNFTVYDQLGAIGDYTGNAGTGEHGQFMPYNELDPNRVCSFTNRTDVLHAELPDSDPRKGEVLYNIGNRVDVDYFFGMELSASFTQTANGLDNWGHDIIFEFSGDDDFWLYVDGELVLDLGGVHSAMVGSVNFRTGTVHSDRGDSTLYAIFKSHYEARGLSQSEVAARLGDIFELKDGNYVFKDYTTHTMKMFYMERGAGASNLKMRFNLASVKPGTAELSKKLTGTQSASNKLMQYPYQIWYATANYRMDESGAYVLDESGEKIVESYNSPEMMEQASLPGDPIRVVYKGTNTLVPFKESLTIVGIEYRNVFLLKAGETAVMMFPEDTYQYKTVECGLNTEIYDAVFVNGENITDEGRLYNNTDGSSGSSGAGQTGRKDFGIGYESTVKRPSVEYTNQVAPNVMRTLSFKKAVYGPTGILLTDAEAAQVDASFSFRLYLGNEFADASALPLADMYTYYIRDPQGYYGMWDSDNQTFTRLDGITTFEQFLELPEDVRRSATYTTSMYGAISKIRAGYTVEVRDLIVGTKYKVEERDSELPRGYTRRSSDGYVRTDLGSEDEQYVYYTENGTYGRHLLTSDSTSNAEPILETITSRTESPRIEIRNQEGWGLTAKKVWTDKDFMTHDPIYLAVYLRTGSGPDYTYTLLPDSVRQLKNGDTEAYFFFQDLKVEGETYSFNQFVVREVELSTADGIAPAVDSDGKVTVDSSVTVTPVADGDTVEVGGTPAGGTHRKETYTVSYETGASTGRNNNIRIDTVTNSRPGIQIFKTDWAGENYLAGAAFTLKYENGDDVAAASYTSDSSGLVTTAYLSPGTYKVAEIKTPAGYVAMAEEITITVSKNQDNEDVFTVTGNEEYYSFAPATGTSMARITVKNRTVQSLTIGKVGVDGDTRTPLGGVRFALYDQVKDNEGNLRPAYSPKTGYSSLASNDSGVIEELSSDLGAGTYYLREVAAPSGYKRLTEDLCFTLGEDGTVTINNAGYSNWLTTDTSVQGTVSYRIEVENTPLGITIRKTDESNTPLAGSKFELSRKNDNNVFTDVHEYGLGANGEIDMETITEKTFHGMSNGTYKLTETRAPAGHIIVTKDIYFAVSDGTVRLTDENGNDRTYPGVTLADGNTTIVVSNTAGSELPAAGGPGTTLLQLLGLLLTGIAGASLVVRRRRRAA